MLNRKPWMTLILAAVLLAGAACTGNSLDNGSSPDVVIEVVTLQNDPVTANEEEGLCTLEVVDWTATIQNNPKNSLAGAESVPFNDVVMVYVDIEYYASDDYERANMLWGPRRVGLGDVAIPAAASNTVTFAPISFEDLDLVLPGTTLNLKLTFYAYTIEGNTITDTVDRQLFIEGCASGG